MFFSSSENGQPRGRASYSATTVVVNHPSRSPYRFGLIGLSPGYGGTRATIITGDDKARKSYSYGGCRISYSLVLPRKTLLSSDFPPLSTIISASS